MSSTASATPTTALSTLEASPGVSLGDVGVSTDKNVANSVLTTPTLKNSSMPSSPQEVFTYLVDNKQQILSGITVALAQVPEAVAFALVAGVDPLVGLQAAWIMGVITAIFGGRPGMISGATGAVAVVMVDLVKDEGVEYLFVAIVIAGILQLIFGFVGGGALVRMIPHPVMVGFCNGLPIVIGLAQFNSFKVPGSADSRRLSWGAFGPFTNGSEWVDGEMGLWMAFHVIIAMSVTAFFPKITNKFPSSLAGIIASTVFEWAIVRPIFDSKSNTVEDIAIVKGTFPIPVWFDDKYTMPPINSDTISKCLFTGVLVAAIGTIESLMTLNLIDDLTDTKGMPNREAMGQGLGQLLAGIFGGMGGCAMIGQSMINVKGGGVTRLSSFTAGFFLLMIILVAYPLINLIPTAALAGVMFMVCYYTFEWSSIAIVCSSCLPLKWRTHEKVNSEKKVNRSDALVVVVVMIVTLWQDLAVAVIAGIVFSSVMYSWNSGCHLQVERVVSTTSTIEDGEKKDSGNCKGPAERVTYYVTGSLFFASIQPFLENFDAKADPDLVQINFSNCDICDWSAIECINGLAEKYENLSKEIHFSKLKINSKKIVSKAKHLTAESLRTILDEGELIEEIIPGPANHLNVERRPSSSPEQRAEKRRNNSSDDGPENDKLTI